MFIVVGGAAMFGLIDMKSGQEAPLLSNFFAEGLFPNGVTALLITMITVNFSFQGTELIGIAAGESENPEKQFQKRSSKRFGVRFSFRLIRVCLSKHDSS